MLKFITAVGRTVVKILARMELNVTDIVLRLAVPLLTQRFTTCTTFPHARLGPVLQYPAVNRVVLKQHVSGLLATETHYSISKERAQVEAYGQPAGNTKRERHPNPGHHSLETRITAHDKQAPLSARPR